MRDAHRPLFRATGASRAAPPVRADLSLKRLPAGQSRRQALHALEHLVRLATKVLEQKPPEGATLAAWWAPPERRPMNLDPGRGDPKQNSGSLAGCSVAITLEHRVKTGQSLIQRARQKPRAIRGIEPPHVHQRPAKDRRRRHVDVKMYVPRQLHRPGALGVEVLSNPERSGRGSESAPRSPNRYTSVRRTPQKPASEPDKERAEQVHRGRRT